MNRVNVLRGMPSEDVGVQVFIEGKYNNFYNPRYRQSVSDYLSSMRTWEKCKDYVSVTGPFGSTNFEAIFYKDGETSVGLWAGSKPELMEGMTQFLSVFLPYDFVFLPALMPYRREVRISRGIERRIGYSRSLDNRPNSLFEEDAWWSFLGDNETHIWLDKPSDLPRLLSDTREGVYPEVL